MSDWPKQKDAVAFYGDPSTHNASWQLANITTVPVPWAMTYSGSPVKAIRIHVKCAKALAWVMDTAWREIGRDQKVADLHGWSLYSGSYNYRPKRTGKSLSMHAFAAAIDWDAGHNAQGSSSKDRIGFTADDPLIRAFEFEGAEWGGRWSGKSCDPMHVQFATTK